ncbi:cytochrome-c oxidase, cbb3-type subunit III [Albirhodobacter sp. R86504]|uniref:cytochrome-c oxidase, cbb3-type subunit III n=1 Tax=Albirhodobacter sp. R86504 TaxID=3093848 RepID=UPI00367121CC
MSKKPIEKKQPSTTGHEWDGIKELNNPLPRWWLWTFYACVVWGVAYSIAMPAWPLINGATPGVLGKSTRADVAAEIARYNEANGPIEAKLASVELTDIAQDPELSDYARNAGESVFETWCAQCHGAGAQGNAGLGYPNLIDDDWLWGGSIEDIHLTITHGIRNTEYEDARLSEMPAFGRDELLEKDQIAQVVQFVQQISGQDHDADLALAGATVFEENCASCHADDGTGIRELGAPNLTDAIWLYGGDTQTLTETVNNARYGVMPGWKERLTEAQIRAVASYIHSSGGGE